MRNIRAQRRKKPEVFELSGSFQLQERNGGTALLRAVCILFLLCAAAAITSPAATKFKSLVSFNGTNGRHPNLTAVVQGLDGNLYGTTEIGGTNNAGTVFKITPGGTLATIYNFCAQSNCPDGAKPEAGLILATDGNFYGTTVAGGTIGAGTVFKITPAGKLITLYNFCSQSGCVDGLNPDAPVFQGTDGNFYGTTKLGGKHGCGGCHGAGTAFKITPAGKLTTIYNFCAQSNCDDGANPTTGLVQGTDGNFYGTTLDGGTKGAGTVFKMTPKGVLTT